MSHYKNRMDAAAKSFAKNVHRNVAQTTINIPLNWTRQRNGGSRCNNISVGDRSPIFHPLAAGKLTRIQGWRPTPRLASALRRTAQLDETPVTLSRGAIGGKELISTTHLEKVFPALDNVLKFGRTSCRNGLTFIIGSIIFIIETYLSIFFAIAKEKPEVM